MKKSDIKLIKDNAVINLQSFVLKQQQGWSKEDAVLKLLLGFLWVNPSIEEVLHHNDR